MKIIACVKQVPDTVEIKIDKETGTLIRDNVPAIMNPFDAYAVEEGILIKEKCGGSLSVITMGPVQAKDVLYEAYSVGADSLIHVCDRAFKGSDTFATAQILAAAIRKIGDVDLILCGKQAIDGDTAQVGPEIAEILGIPHVAYVKKIREVNEKYIICERMVETGVEILKIQLPAMLTVLKDINTPRLPSFKLKRKAKEQVIPMWGLNDLGIDESAVGLEGSPTMVLRTFTPQVKGGCRILSGTSEEQIDEILDIVNNLD